MACRVAALESRTRSIASQALAIDAEFDPQGIALSGMTTLSLTGVVPQSCRLISGSRRELIGQASVA